jgi:hypothetical protein
MHCPNAAKPQYSVLMWKRVSGDPTPVAWCLFCVCHAAGCSAGYVVYPNVSPGLIQVQWGETRDEL